ncbi:hypothetical protein EAG_01903 [Camponotus floridanus]|uniref:Uncharacterized protein n=1 Tax=Camponotus floridanus TaxID=104421 RepID=E1ZZ03_CAMFO|nr:hypothetical protein EAG_01903 [Camponotus floridanus]
MFQTKVVEDKPYAKETSPKPKTGTTAPINQVENTQPEPKVLAIAWGTASIHSSASRLKKRKVEFRAAPIESSRGHPYQNAILNYRTRFSFEETEYLFAEFNSFFADHRIPRTTGFPAIRNAAKTPPQQTRGLRPIPSA